MNLDKDMVIEGLQLLVIEKDEEIIKIQESYNNAFEEYMFLADFLQKEMGMAAVFNMLIDGKKTLSQETFENEEIKQKELCLFDRVISFLSI